MSFLCDECASEFDEAPDLWTCSYCGAEGCPECPRKQCEACQGYACDGTCIISDDDEDICRSCLDEQNQCYCVVCDCRGDDCGCGMASVCGNCRRAS